MPRYIDADALIDNIPQADLSNDKKISKCGAIADMVLLVCDAPTIDVAPVVHCENCQHIHILNTSEIYAICDKTNFIFQPFGVDTREFGCPYGERRESEESK